MEYTVVIELISGALFPPCRSHVIYLPKSFIFLGIRNTLILAILEKGVGIQVWG